MEQELQSLIEQASDIVIIQADNPDGDSLASALALEQMLGDTDKRVHLYCGVNIPTYLRYMAGWDRVQDTLPSTFDLSIIVDTSSLTLLEQLGKNQELGWLRSKPCIVIDHHIEAEPTIDFATIAYIRPAVATGEILYELAEQLNWQRSSTANNMLMSSIMSDSLGLTSDGTTARSIEIVSELVRQGVSIPALESARRELHRKSPQLLKYKAKLLERIGYSDDGAIAHVTIPWEEIEKYSPEYNPSVLVIDEMRFVTGVDVAIAFKTYPDGKVTAKIRANYGKNIAGELASRFGGGGHPYAAGFKVTSGKPFNEIKSECIRTAQELLATLKQDTDNETIQHTYSVG